MAGKVLAHRDYKVVAEQNLEHIRNDIWDVEITKWPTAVYNPGYDMLKRRLQTFDPGTDTQPVNISKNILGHEVNSPGGRNSQPVDITFTWNDREDQAITYMVNDYLNQSGDSDTGFSRHKTELMFECSLIFYNTLLKPVRRIEYYTGLYGSSSIHDNVGEHGGDNSTVSLTVHCEHHKRFII